MSPFLQDLAHAFSKLFSGRHDRAFNVYLCSARSRRLIYYTGRL